MIRLCRDDEHAAMTAIVNAAADAYRGVIPPHCWREPYMTMSELEQEIAAGVTFWGYESDGVLAGVMGIQHVRDVNLIRHAYVLPSWQRRGVASALITHLRDSSARQLLVGTWTAAEWAVDLYLRNGFELVSCETKDRLLRAYWSIPDSQIEASVVLANPPLALLS